MPLRLCRSPNDQHDIESRVQDVPRPETWVEHIAHWISQMGSPPIMSLSAFFVTLHHLSVPRAWLWSGPYIVFAVIGPLAFLCWQIGHGHVTDLDIYFRKQRKWSILVTAIGTAIVWGAMRLGEAPEILLVMVGSHFLQWLGIYMVTLCWKISVHATVASGVAFFLIWGFGIAATPLAMIIPLVAWSRVKLRRHSPAQVFAGVLLGAAAFSAALLLSPIARTPGSLIR